MIENGSSTIHVRIEGRVQGVSYRYWTEGNARELGLYGWVRNRLDGSVEAVFSGSAEKIDLMINRCAQGPRMAEVEKVEVLEENDKPYQDFKILKTE